MPPIKIFPSILAADMGDLRAECRRAVAAGPDGLHIDIMDAHFVPNLSYCPDTVAMVRASVEAHLNVHLMMTHPHKYVDAFLDAGSDTLSIHVESESDIAETLGAIRARGVRAGLVLNPDTELAALEPFEGLYDEILFMTVYPGFGGQAFIAEVLDKVETYRLRHPDMDIALDGGLNRETVAQSIPRGANLFHMGTSLFKADDMAGDIEWLRAGAGTTS